MLLLCEVFLANELGYIILLYHSSTIFKLEIAYIRVLNKLEVDARFGCACIATFHNQVLLLFLLLSRLTYCETKC